MEENGPPSFLPRVLYFQSERLNRPQMSAYTAFFV